MTITISQRTVYTAVYEALAAIPGMTNPDTGEPNIYYQAATGPLPEGRWGHIRPGIILDTRFPSPIGDYPVNEVQGLDARTFRVQTRCFAATPEVLMDMTDAIAEVLTGLHIGRGVLRHATDDDPTQPFFLDPDLGRPYTALYWRIATQ